jgi:hypothetical protein
MTTLQLDDPRAPLLTALHADLVGPFSSDAPNEQLPIAPSRWYLTGFLAPEVAREILDPTAADEFAAGDDDDAEDTAAEEPQPKLPKLFPASIGLSVLLPPDAPPQLTARVAWAEYTRTTVPLDPAVDGSTRKRDPQVWQRHPKGPFNASVPLDVAKLLKGVAIPNTDHVVLQGKLEPADIHGLPKGTRALSLFLVNRRPIPAEKGHADEAFLFQVALELECTAGFLPRPDRTAESEERDRDDRIADLQYRDRFEIAVGHGIAVEVVPDAVDPNNQVTRVRTTWIPTSVVHRVKTHDEPTIDTRMIALGELDDAESVTAKLGPLPTGYRAWLATQEKITLDSDERRKLRKHLLDEARQACVRIEDGIALLREDETVRRAFALANRAMADAARARMGIEDPRWRMFQLAFVLLNLRGLADPNDASRQHVELVFFPTGGGKTEAYLGVIAFALILRRLRAAADPQARPDAGLGVTVLLRYTLRLLTLDQLGRAATLVCALERLRAVDTERLGTQRFSVGLWVGRTATANTLVEVARKVTEYKNNRAGSPFPLTECPWCRTAIKPDCFSLYPKPTRAEEVRVACVNPECDFSGRRTHGDGLPVVFVDEQIYRELPCFLVATVDKFAMLPWRGETGMLFGHVTARNGRYFYGPTDGRPDRQATKLPEGLRPPELVVQDELHLISGPLGTMVGLYETAIDRLCTYTDTAGKPIAPKIIASTATVRRARRQIQALFGRRVTHVFPPPAVDAFESWFATVDRVSPGRVYVGVAGNGRPLKAILLRTYTALLAASVKQHDPRAAPEQTADGYMTLVGYFNSLRELGGMRRLVEDDVRTRCDQAADRRPRDVPRHPWVTRRKIREPVELTSRKSTADIATARRRLGTHFTNPESVDVVLASNMISVGIDIDRLGLMVVAGQPKTTSEYIQATSRVGRDPRWPGLVVACFNVHKPRDRSHYERFSAYHECFYRFVEATSVTPFSAPAIDRGLAGVLTALVRHGDDEMTPPGGVMSIEANRSMANEMVEAIAARAGEQPGFNVNDDGDAKAKAALREDDIDRLRDRGTNLLDAWTTLVTSASTEGAGKRGYSPYEKPRVGRVLLRSALEVADVNNDLVDEERKFSASTSMRDVEATVHLWVERRSLGGRS